MLEVCDEYSRLDYSERERSYSPLRISVIAGPLIPLVTALINLFLLNS
jgi:hypothetical protein